MYGYNAGPPMATVIPYCVIHENIRELQLPRLQTALRPRCQPVTHCAGCISANTRPHQLYWSDRECWSYMSCTCNRWLDLDLHRYTYVCMYVHMAVYFHKSAILEIVSKLKCDVQDLTIKLQMYNSVRAHSQYF